MSTTAGRRLDGEVAVVTGAGSGIGRAAATALAGAGAAVVLVGRRPGPLQETSSAITEGGGRALVQAADVADASQVALVADAVRRTFGHVDILVNNAGTNVPVRALDRVSIDDWRRVVEVNLHGPFLMTHAMLPLLRGRGGGTIVNVSSMAGITASVLSGPAYSAAKHALNSFTESINLAERARGIRACAICPGEVATSILDARPMPPSAESRATMLQPEDVASTIVHVVTLPPRATIELIAIRPTLVRDTSAETP
jgi:NADP-dependent 3-hydroxy acid dehydrogenase YdfG